MTRHFLRDDDLTPDELLQVLDLADQMKADRHRHRPLTGPQSVALIFDKQTLRSQLSFAVGVAELGGYPITVDGRLAGIGERESIADTTRVLSRQVAAIVWRTFGQQRIDEMAAHSSVPVVNALTDAFHPCQLLADLQTIREHKGGLAGLRVAFVGDGACNMGHSWLLAGATAGMQVEVGCPENYGPDPLIVKRAAEIARSSGGSVHVDHDARTAVLGADVVVTDTWVSMGVEEQAAERLRSFAPFALTSELLAHAKPDAIVLHCLPAYRGKEIAAEVIDGPQSVVWDEAENRLHAQKALLTFLLEHP
jgi:ornithine carbamoyltransferase